MIMDSHNEKLMDLLEEYDPLYNPEDNVRNQCIPLRSLFRRLKNLFYIKNQFGIALVPRYIILEDYEAKNIHGQIYLKIQYKNEVNSYECQIPCYSEDKVRKSFFMFRDTIKIKCSLYRNPRFQNKFLSKRMHFLLFSNLSTTLHSLYRDINIGGVFIDISKFAQQQNIFREFVFEIPSFRPEFSKIKLCVGAIAMQHRSNYPLIDMWSGTFSSIEAQLLNFEPHQKIFKLLHHQEGENSIDFVNKILSFYEGGNYQSVYRISCDSPKLLLAVTRCFRDLSVLQNGKLTEDEKLQEVLIYLRRIGVKILPDVARSILYSTSKSCKNFPKLLLKIQQAIQDALAVKSTSLSYKLHEDPYLLGVNVCPSRDVASSSISLLSQENVNVTSSSQSPLSFNSLTSEDGSSNCSSYEKISGDHPNDLLIDEVKSLKKLCQKFANNHYDNIDYISCNGAQSIPDREISLDCSSNSKICMFDDPKDPRENDDIQTKLEINKYETENHNDDPSSKSGSWNKIDFDKRLDEDYDDETKNKMLQKRIIISQKVQRLLQESSHVAREKKSLEEILVFSDFKYQFDIPSHLHDQRSNEQKFATDPTIHFQSKPDSRLDYIVDAEIMTVKAINAPLERVFYPERFKSKNPPPDYLECRSKVYERALEETKNTDDDQANMIQVAEDLGNEVNPSIEPLKSSTDPSYCDFIGSGFGNCEKSFFLNGLNTKNLNNILEQNSNVPVAISKSSNKMCDDSSILPKSIEYGSDKKEKESILYNLTGDLTPCRDENEVSEYVEGTINRHKKLLESFEQVPMKSKYSYSSVRKIFSPPENFPANLHADYVFRQDLINRREYLNKIVKPEHQMVCEKFFQISSQIFNSMKEAEDLFPIYGHHTLNYYADLERKQFSGTVVYPQYMQGLPPTPVIQQLREELRANIRINFDIATGMEKRAINCLTQNDVDSMEMELEGMKVIRDKLQGYVFNLKQLFVQFLPHLVRYPKEHIANLGESISQIEAIHESERTDEQRKCLKDAKEDMEILVDALRLTMERKRMLS